MTSMHDITCIHDRLNRSSLRLVWHPLFMTSINDFRDMHPWRTYLPHHDWCGHPQSMKIRWYIHDTNPLLPDVSSSRLVWESSIHDFNDIHNIHLQHPWHPAMTVSPVFIKAGMGILHQWHPSMTSMTSSHDSLTCLHQGWYGHPPFSPPGNWKGNKFVWNWHYFRNHQFHTASISID